MSVATRLGLVAAVVVAAVVLTRLGAERESGTAPEDADMVVYTTPGCACCRSWIDLMRAEGFTLAVIEQSAAEVVALKSERGLPPGAFGCHTALVEGYVVEGHVPPEDLRRLLRERPSGIGLAVPGMPPGSPGMTGRNEDGYRVLLIDSGGGASPYRHVAPDAR